MTLAHHRAVVRAGSRKLKPITERTNNGDAAKKGQENVVGASSTCLDCNLQAGCVLG